MVFKKEKFETKKKDCKRIGVSKLILRRKLVVKEGASEQLLEGRLPFYILFIGFLGIFYLACLIGKF